MRPPTGHGIGFCPKNRKYGQFGRRLCWNSDPAWIILENVSHFLRADWEQKLSRRPSVAATFKIEPRHEFSR
jgi:hypothetical protein